MANVATFNADAMRGLAAVVERSMASLVGARALDTRVEVGEGFPVWVLGFEDAADAGNSLAGAAHPTGLWHHNIFANGEPAYFARGRATGEEGERGYRLEQLFESPLPARIDSAIEAADEMVEDSFEVRLLEVPALLVAAFWFASSEEAESDRVLVISAPDDRLMTREPTTAGNFLEAVRHSQPITGVE